MINIPCAQGERRKRKKEDKKMTTPFDNSPLTILTDSAADAVDIAIKAKLLGNLELWGDDEKIADAVACLCVLLETLNQAADERGLTVGLSLYQYYRSL